MAEISASRAREILSQDRRARTVVLEDVSRLPLAGWAEFCLDPSRRARSDRPPCDSRPRARTGSGTPRAQHLLPTFPGAAAFCRHLVSGGPQYSACVLRSRPTEGVRSGGSRGLVQTVGRPHLLGDSARRRFRSAAHVGSRHAQDRRAFGTGNGGRVDRPYQLQSHVER